MADEYLTAALYGMKRFSEWASKKVKELMWMEKLIELFKEYVDNHWTDTKDIEKEYWVIDDWQWFLYWTREYLYEIIISKKFWFIEWLVENEKIEEWNFFYNTWDLPDDDVSKLLMLLSIQDEPIEFLVSILK